MTDRREAVAKAGYEANLAWQAEDGWGYPPDWENETPAVLDVWGKIADAAIAAMQAAEPTDAEIDAAFGAAWHAWESKNDGTRTSDNLLHDAVRAALVAARTVK